MDPHLQNANFTFILLYESGDIYKIAFRANVNLVKIYEKDRNKEWVCFKEFNKTYEKSVDWVNLTEQIKHKSILLIDEIKKEPSNQIREFVVL